MIYSFFSTTFFSNEYVLKAPGEVTGDTGRLPRGKWSAARRPTDLAGVGCQNLVRCGCSWLRTEREDGTQTMTALRAKYSKEVLPHLRSGVRSRTHGEPSGF